MIDKKIAALLNNQINLEWFSAYFYLDIYGYYMDQNLNGFGNWFYVQTQEERDHALLFMQYMQNNNLKVSLDAIGKPEISYIDSMSPLKAGLEHEEFVTASIHTIYDSAYQVKDFRTMQFLDWFIKEQGEEEKSTEDIIKKYDLFGTDPRGLYLLDAELATRVYTVPSLVI